MNDRRPDELPDDGLAASLARLFDDEVERARIDLEASTSGVRLHRVRRQGASHAGSLAAIVVAGAVLVAVLALRPNPGRPAASTASASPGNFAASPLIAAPVPGNDPAAWKVITWSLLSAPAFAGPGNQYVAQILSWRQGFIAVGWEEAEGVDTGCVALARRSVLGNAPLIPNQCSSTRASDRSGAGRSIPGGRIHITPQRLDHRNLQRGDARDVDIRRWTALAAFDGRRGDL